MAWGLWLPHAGELQSADDRREFDARQTFNIRVSMASRVVVLFLDK